jgi:hypothetical protein
MKHCRTIACLITLLIAASACNVPSASPVTASPILSRSPATVIPTAVSAQPTMPSPSPVSTSTPTANDRAGAIEFETLRIKDKTNVNAGVQDMARYGAQQWGNGMQLFCSAKLDGILRFDMPVNLPGNYALDLYATKAPDYGQIQVLLDGNPFGKVIDLYAASVMPSGRIPVGIAKLENGTHLFDFRVVGKNATANNYNFGLDSYTLNATTSSPPPVTLPPPNPAYPLMTVPVQAIRLSDDNGGRPTPVTRDQIKQWIDKANEIWAGASIRFLYDPDSDFTMLKSTLLNSMNRGTEDKNWDAERSAGNAVATQYPGKLVFLFRYGPGANPVGPSFSWFDYNFVVGMAFDTSVCGYQNIGLMAHEIGHYLGLPHPFPKVFNSIQEAEEYLQSHGNDPNAFDGDGIADTPPDPYIETNDIQCKPVASVTLKGKEFPLPRTDIMSYYEVRTGLSPQQIDRARWILRMRQQNGMAMPTNRGIPGAMEFEALPIKDKTDLSTSVQDMSPWGAHQWSGGKQLFCSARLNSSVRFTISVGSTGKYALNLYATMAPDFGQIQTRLDGKPFGAPVDLRAPIVMPSGKVAIGTIDLSAGTHDLEFRVVGKNAASSQYSFGLDAFTLTLGQ